jgi:DNA-binding NarL/FixJ family response regulator
MYSPCSSKCFGTLAFALRQWRSDADILGVENPAIDAVVLDCGMPGEPSAQLALHAKSLSLPVVMISGHIKAMQFADENGLQLLRMAGLLNAIDEAMRSGEFGQRDA